MSGDAPVTVTFSCTVATLSVHVDVERLGDVQHDPLLLELGEAGQLDRDVVRADRQRRQTINAFGVADDVRVKPVSVFRPVTVAPGTRGPLLVEDAACDVAASSAARRRASRERRSPAATQMKRLTVSKVPPIVLNDLKVGAKPK